MSVIRVTIVDGPISPALDDLPIGHGLAGAVVRFEGIVRRMENGRELLALDYQVYQPMAEQVLQRLAAEVLARRGLLALGITHSRGRVPVGACSMVLALSSPHRAEALAAAAEFIDALKRDAPIWKTPVWASGD